MIHANNITRILNKEIIYWPINEEDVTITTAKAVTYNRQTNQIEIHPAEDDKIIIITNPNFDDGTWVGCMYKLSSGIMRTVNVNNPVVPFNKKLRANINSK